MKQKQCSRCLKTVPIYRNISIDGTRLRLCKFCYPKQKLITKKKPKLLSSKRTSQVSKYQKACKEFKLQPENQHCPVINKLKGITVQTTDVHHIKGRENDMLLDQKHWLAVSREGHQWIHNNPEESRKMGWLI